MSSLLQQLTRLQAETVKTTGSGMAKRVPTLIFGDRAKQIPLRVIHEISVAALLELQGYDERFCRFTKSLFGEEAVDYDRDVHTAQENAELDSEMAGFLDLLVPWLDLGAAPRALEFLIRRYRLDLHLGDRLLLAFLPYHETEVFRTLVDSLSATANTPEKIKQDSLLGIIGTGGWPAPRQALRPALLRNSCALLGKLREYVVELSPCASSQAFYARFVSVLACDSLREGARSRDPDTAKGRALISQVEELARYCCNRKRQPELRYLGFTVLLSLTATHPEAVADSRVLRDCLAQLLDAGLERPGAALRAGTREAASAGLAGEIRSTPSADSAGVLLSLAKTLSEAGERPSFSAKACGKALLLLNAYVGECVQLRRELSGAGGSEAAGPALLESFLEICESARAFFASALDGAEGAEGASVGAPVSASAGVSANASRNVSVNASASSQEAGDKHALVVARARELSESLRKILEAERSVSRDAARARAGQTNSGRAEGSEERGGVESTASGRSGAQVGGRQPSELSGFDSLLGLPLQDLQRRAVSASSQVPGRSSGQALPLSGVPGLARTLAFAWITGVGGEAGRAAVAWSIYSLTEEVLAVLNRPDAELPAERCVCVRLLTEALEYSADLLSSGRLPALSGGLLLEGLQSLQFQDRQLSGAVGTSGTAERAGAPGTDVRRRFWERARQSVDELVKKHAKEAVRGAASLKVSTQAGKSPAGASASPTQAFPGSGEGDTFQLGFMSEFLASLSRLAELLDSGALDRESQAFAVLSASLHRVEGELAAWVAHSSAGSEEEGKAIEAGEKGATDKVEETGPRSSLAPPGALVSRFLLDRAAIARKTLLAEEKLLKADHSKACASASGSARSDEQAADTFSFSPLRIAAALRELAILKGFEAEAGPLPLLVIYLTDAGSLAHTDPVLARLCARAGEAGGCVKDATAYAFTGPLDCGALARAIKRPANAWERALSENPRVLLQSLALRKGGVDGFPALLRVLLARASELASSGVAFSAVDEERTNGVVTLSMLASLIERVYGAAVDGDELSGLVPDSNDASKLCSLTLWDPEFLACTASLDSARFLRDVARPWLRAAGEMREMLALRERLSGAEGEDLESRAKLERLHARLMAVPQLLGLCIAKLGAAEAVNIGYELLNAYYGDLSGGIVVEMAGRLVEVGFCGFGKNGKPAPPRKSSGQAEGGSAQAQILVRLILESLARESWACGEAQETSEGSGRDEGNASGEVEGVMGAKGGAGSFSAAASGKASEPREPQPAEPAVKSIPASLPEVEGGEFPLRSPALVGGPNVPSLPVFPSISKAEAILSSSFGMCACRVVIGLFSALRDGRVPAAAVEPLLAALCSEVSSPHFVSLYLEQTVGGSDAAGAAATVETAGAELFLLVLSLHARLGRPQGAPRRESAKAVQPSGAALLLSQTCRSLSELVPCEVIAHRALEARREAQGEAFGRSSSSSALESPEEAGAVASEAYSLLNSKLRDVAGALKDLDPQLRGELEADVSATCAALAAADDVIFSSEDHLECLLALLSSFPRVRADFVEMSSKLLKAAERAREDISDEAASRSRRVDSSAGPAKVLSLALLSLVQIVDAGRPNLIPRIPGLFAFCLGAAEAKASLYAEGKNAAAFTEDTVATLYLLLALMLSYSRFSSPYLQRLVVSVSALLPKGQAQFSGEPGAAASASAEKQESGEPADEAATGDAAGGESHSIPRPKILLPSSKNELSATNPYAAQAFRVASQILSEISRAFPLKTVLALVLGIVGKVGSPLVNSEVVLYSVGSLAWRSIERVMTRKTPPSAEEVKGIMKFAIDGLRIRAGIQDLLSQGGVDGSSTLGPLTRTLAGFEADRFESLLGLVSSQVLLALSGIGNPKLVSLPLDMLLSWPADDLAFSAGLRGASGSERRSSGRREFGKPALASDAPRSYLTFLSDFAAGLGNPDSGAQSRLAAQVDALSSMEQHVTAVSSAGKWPLASTTSLLHALAVMAGSDPDELFSLMGNRIYPLVSQLVVFISKEMPNFQVWVAERECGAELADFRSLASKTGGVESREAPLAVCVAPAGLAVSGSEGPRELPWGYYGYVQLLRYAMLVLFAAGQAEEVLSSDLFPRVCDVFVAALGSPELCALQRFPEYVYAALESVLASAGGMSVASTLWGEFHERLIKLIEVSGEPGPDFAAHLNVKSCRVRCVESLSILYKVADQEALAMLPQSLGLITELLEDTEPRVERAARKLVAVVEEISGEPFNKLLS